VLVEEFDVGHRLYDCRGEGKRTVLANGGLAHTLLGEEKTLTLTLSRGTGRGDKRDKKKNYECAVV
jgi:hypothetical protein